MAGIMVMATIPAGRRLISQVGGEPKAWLTNSRIGAALTIGSAIRKAPHVRVVSPISKHDDMKQHLGYVAILGIAAGMVALVCFYLCVWLLRQSRQRAATVQLPIPRDHQPQYLEHGEELEDHDESEMMKRGGASGDGEYSSKKKKQTRWNSESVELVLMAGHHVPTFVAHPVVQCPPQQENVH